jgi:thymidylate synthase (FAD)
MKVLELSYEVEDKLTAVDGIRMAKAIEKAARTCYKSEHMIGDGSMEALVRHCIQKGHESVLEHEKVTVRFVLDRGLSHEMVRHRIASFSQESTRYCNYSQDKFGGEVALVPMMDGLTPAQVERRMKLWAEMERVYLAEVEEGVKPQQARDNLPTCLKTEIVVTANLREWRHILRLRTGKAAHPQMRRLMTPLLALFKQRIPVIFDDLSVEGEETA